MNQISVELTEFEKMSTPTRSIKLSKKTTLRLSLISIGLTLIVR